jgi:hypothetical protein
MKNILGIICVVFSLLGGVSPACAEALRFQDRAVVDIYLGWKEKDPRLHVQSGEVFREKGQTRLELVVYSEVEPGRLFDYTLILPEKDSGLVLGR